MKVIVRNADGDLVELARYINRGGWEVVNKAEEGAVGVSTLYMDDLDESVYETLGYNDGARRQIRLVDMDSNKIVHFGYTGKRTLSRRKSDYGGPLTRAWGIDILDPNAILQRRVLHHKDANRKRETDVERMQALFDMPEWDLIHQFLIGSSTTTMSKHDYRGMTVGQYIADCVQASRKNYWVDMVDLSEGDGEELTLWYGRDTRDAYVSTLSISDDPDDIDFSALRNGTSLVYPPSKDTEYTMEPDRVIRGIWATGAEDSVYRSRNTLGTQFERWDTAVQFPTVHEFDRLKAKAESFLDRFEDEEEIITTAILVPSDMAHLVRAGMIIPIKLTYVPRLTEFTDCRILSRGLSPRGDGRRYTIPLTLEPIGPADPEPTCGGIDETIIATDLGGSLRFSWDTPPAVGQHMVSLISTRGLHDTNHVPLAKSVSPPPESVVGSEWDYLGYEDWGIRESVEAASKVATTDDVSGVFDWVNLAGSCAPVGISVKFTGATDASDVFSTQGIDDIDMTLGGITVSEPGILVIMFQEHGFDQPPAIMTPPAGMVELVSGHVRVGGGLDWISAGYMNLAAAGTYSLTWHASNTYPDWSWEAIAVFVAVEAC